jgi:hypothetical protein
MKQFINRLSLSLIVVLGFACTTVFEQTVDQLTTREVVKRVRQLSAELNLTPDQKAKIRPILMTEVPKLKAVRDDKSMPQPEKTAKMHEIFNGMKDQIRPLLTPYQIKKLQKMKEDSFTRKA